LQIIKLKNITLFIHLQNTCAFYSVHATVESDANYNACLKTKHKSL